MVNFLLWVCVAVRLRQRNVLQNARNYSSLFNQSYQGFVAPSFMLKLPNYSYSLTNLSKHLHTGSKKLHSWLVTHHALIHCSTKLVKQCSTNVGNNFYQETKKKTPCQQGSCATIKCKISKVQRFNRQLLNET